MKREFLRNLGIGEEAVDQIMTEYGKDLEGYKSAGETAQKEAADWRQRYQQREEQIAREQEQQSFTAELQRQLREAGAKSVKAAEALLDQEGLFLEEGKIRGLDQQLSSLQEEYPYLFASQEEAPPHAVASATGGGQEQRSLFSVIRSAAGL